MKIIKLWIMKELKKMRRVLKKQKMRMEGTIIIITKMWNILKKQIWNIVKKIWKKVIKKKKMEEKI